MSFGIWVALTWRSFFGSHGTFWDLASGVEAEIALVVERHTGTPSGFQGFISVAFGEKKALQ